MYLPWMILTGYEIAGNVAVAVTFSTSPGHHIITSLSIIQLIFYRIFILDQLDMHIQSVNITLGVCQCYQKKNDLVYRTERKVGDILIQCDHCLEI